MRLSRLRGDLPEEILELEHENRPCYIHYQQVGSPRRWNSLRSEKIWNLDLQDSAALIEKYETQQMTVRNNASTMRSPKRIESQKQATDNGRSRLEEIAIILEESSRKMTDLKAELADLEETYTSKKSNLTELWKKTRNEEDELLKVREEAKAKVDTRYLRSYERLRNGLHNGIAVVAMEKGACLGMMLPPQVQNEVRKMNKVIIDENSGRIVIDPEFFENARAQFKF